MRLHTASPPLKPWLLMVGESRFVMKMKVIALTLLPTAPRVLLLAPYGETPAVAALIASMLGQMSLPSVAALWYGLPDCKAQAVMA